MRIQTRLFDLFDALFLTLSGALTITLLFAMLQPLPPDEAAQRSGDVVAAKQTEAQKRA